MTYADVCSDGAAFHTVACPIDGSSRLIFDNQPPLTWISAGLFVRVAANGSTLMACAQGWTTGTLIVGNNAGAKTDLGATHGTQCVAIEPAGAGFRIGAVVSGTQWKTWLVSADLSSVSLEGVYPVPAAISGTSQGWLNFTNGQPVWTDLNRS